ncbi:MAG: glycosyltransferase, partial [Candidatus Methylomirabilis sp.]|nr:glycosyltransferase [Deltaproteobacteria bacterium]
LAYTSTPFRGLDLLLDALPDIRSAAPEATLRVFSGMRVYRQDPAEEAARYGGLYRRCAATPGAAYEGPVAQPALAAALRETAVLAYPNTFPETSCIAVMEAMAAGCRVVTSDLGALGETSAGFAALVPPRATPEAYRGRFVQEVLAALAGFEGPRRAETEARLRAQVDWTLRECSWKARAWEWIAWFEALRVSPSARAA